MVIPAIEGQELTNFGVMHLGLQQITVGKGSVIFTRLLNLVVLGVNL